MSIVNDLANFRIYGVTPSKFAASQFSIKAFRDMGEDFWVNASSNLHKNFVKDGKLRPFTDGIYSLTKELSRFASKNPDYIGAFGASAFGLYNLGKLIYKYEGAPKMTISQNIALGFSNNIKDIIDNPLYSILGLSTAIFAIKKIHDNFDVKDKK